MKKTIFFVAGLFFSSIGMAQENSDDFSNFMKEEMRNFDKFIDDALSLIHI